MKLPSKTELAIGKIDVEDAVTKMISRKDTMIRTFLSRISPEVISNSLEANLERNGKMIAGPLEDHVFFSEAKLTRRDIKSNPAMKAFLAEISENDAVKKVSLKINGYAHHNAKYPVILIEFKNPNKPWYARLFDFSSKKTVPALPASTPMDQLIHRFQKAEEQIKASGAQIDGMKLDYKKLNDGIYKVSLVLQNPRENISIIPAQRAVIDLELAAEEMQKHARIGSADEKSIKSITRLFDTIVAELEQVSTEILRPLTLRAQIGTEALADNIVLRLNAR